MKPKFVFSLATVVVLASAMALAQAGGASSSALPAAPGTANDPPAAAMTGGGSKIAAINIEGAIFASNEGQRDMDALQKKFEPRSNELKGKSEEIDGLKKQLNTQGDKLNDESKASLQRQIELKQKELDRAAQDAREDFQNQQNEIGQRILQKMAPLLLKYTLPAGSAERTVAQVRNRSVAADSDQAPKLRAPQRRQVPLRKRRAQLPQQNKSDTDS